MSVSIQYLIVAGSGGCSTSGGGTLHGGSGAGAVRSGTIPLAAGSYAVTVGGGGGAANPVGENGGYSSVASIDTANGGGGGGANSNGANGGNGGGGGVYLQTAYAGGAGNQGYAGGAGGVNVGGTNIGGGGGGGGAGGAGTAGNANGTGGNGGPGISSSIDGTSKGYAAGGYGIGSTTNGSQGTGGGTAGDGAVGASNGNAGIVVLRFLTADVSTSSGGTKTTDGSYTIHTFTSSGTFAFTAPTVTNKSFAGAVTPGGTIAKAMSYPRAWAGAFTSTGTLAKSMAYARGWAGTLTSAGALEAAVFRPPAFVHVQALLADSDAWIDLSPDVLATEGMRWRRGMGGSGPLDRVATTGTLAFALRNDAGNSGGLQSWYSPGATVCRSGWTHGIPIRLVAEWDGQYWPLWRGKIRTINPGGGRYLGRPVFVTAQDYMNDLAEKRTRNVVLQVSQTDDVLVQALLDAMPADAQPVGVDLDTGIDTIPYAFDTVGAGANAMGLLSDICTTTFGFLFINREGRLVYRNRLSLANEPSLYNLTDSELLAPRAEDFVVPSSLDSVFNRVRITLHPKILGATATDVLYASPAAVLIAAGTTVSVWGSYADPENVLHLIGGLDHVVPLVAYTDYEARENVDGSGADLTGNISITTTPFASTAFFEIENTGGVDAYLVTSAGAPLLQLRGRTVSDIAPLTVESYIARAYGDRALDIDQPLQASTLRAQLEATYLRNQYSVLAHQVERIPVNPDYSSALKAICLALEIGQILTLSETVTGIATVPLVVRAIDNELSPNNVWSLTFTTGPQGGPATDWGQVSNRELAGTVTPAGIVHKAVGKPAQAGTIGPAGALSAVYVHPWQLEVVGRSELGDTTQLG